MARNSLARRKERLREMLLLMFERHKERCFLCGEQLSEKDIPPRRVDELTIHHLSYSPEEKVIVHRRCHKAHHLRERRK